MLVREKQVAKRIRAAIRRDKAGEFLHKMLDKHPKYPYAGYCYVASEAFIHLTSKKYSLMHIGGAGHYFVMSPDGRVIDLTAEQFENKLDYTKARRRALFTKTPSRRGQKLIEATK